MNTMDELIKKFIDLVSRKEKEITRQMAEGKAYENEITKEKIFEDFCRKVNSIIKQKSEFHSTCAVIEIDEKAVLERMSDLEKKYGKEEGGLGYEVKIADETFLGEGWGESYLFLSWKRKEEA